MTRRGRVQETEEKMKMMSREKKDRKVGELNLPETTR
jgi:hypothetical protein